MLFLKDEDKKINIIKPKYAFCNKIYPYNTNKGFWDFLQQVFCLGPEIKMESEKIEQEPGKFIYKRDFLKYIKINCILLPAKKNIYNINEYKIKVIKELQTFSFFFNKYKKVTGLSSHLQQIIKKYNINIVDINNYKCWIDLNYFNFDKLYEKITKKIPDIYNMYNNNNFSSLNLEQLEKEDEKENKDNSNNKKYFGFKLFPLNLFSNEKLINIFPNLFTNNFDRLNENKKREINEKLNCSDKSADTIKEFNKYPEFNIIIEQIVGSFFSKNQKIKYKIAECSYENCKSKGIMTKSCECGKKYYCSEKCKNLNKKYHEEECSELLLQYFLDIVKTKSNKITDESLIGIKGIRNIGNTCYINTAIQCLSNCTELRNYFLFGNPHNDINRNNILGYKGLIAYGFEFIIKSLWVEKENVLDISKFKKAVGVCNDRFRGMNQQDTHEFVTFLIDSLHEDLNRVKSKIYIKKEERDLPDDIKSKIEWNNFLRRNQSILVDLFYGQFKSTVTCQECKKTCVDFNSFSSLSLNLTNSKKNEKNSTNNELTSKLDNLNLNLNINQKTNNENLMTTIEESKNEEEKNNENESDNIEKKIIQNNENIKKNLTVNVRTENITLFRNESSNENSYDEKQGKLVGGKESPSEAQSESLLLLNNEDSNPDEFYTKIRVIFFLYSNDEKILQFILPIKDKKELTYKGLLHKISKIFNKDPYSLYLYHVKDKNIINVYGENDSNIYHDEKLLLISEINKEIIKKNLTKLTNDIFYNASMANYNKIKFTDREAIEKGLRNNRDIIRECINNVINEEKKDFIKIEDQRLKVHSMNPANIYQFTLKNYFFEEKKNTPSEYYYPKIVVFPKKANIHSLYIELFDMNKTIILENDSYDTKWIDINRPNILTNYFSELMVVNNLFNANEIYSKENVTKILPFYLGLQKYSSVDDQYGKEEYLLLNDKDKTLNKIIKDIAGDEYKFPNEQIILKVYWNPIYNNKLKSILKPEKIDSFLFNLIDLDKNLDKNKEEDVQINGNKMIYNSYHKNNKNKIFNEDFKTEVKKKSNNTNFDNLTDKKNTLITKYLSDNSKKTKKENKNEKCIDTIPEISLMDSFEMLREEEILDENNEWYCENCKKKQKAMKKIEIFNAPKILIIQLKRFNNSNKISTKVNFPLTDLDISKYVLSKDRNPKLQYDLFAVANHYGSLHYGHYTAFCKNSIKNKWYEFNDSIATEINDESKIVSQNSYVLFYKQKDLSKLNWKNIFHKKFVNIDIDNQNALIDFNFDYIYNFNSENKDINEYDKSIMDSFMKKEQENNSKINNNENCFNVKENSKYNDKEKESNDFLCKKRSSFDK